MTRKTFLRHTALLGSIASCGPAQLLSAVALKNKDFPKVRVEESERNFRSQAVEEAITTFLRKCGRRGALLAVLTTASRIRSDTTVTYSEPGGRPDTYVITGDIDAMWLRDSSAQVWPYLQFADQDPALHDLIAGVINRQTSYILKDPYANAFYDDPEKRGEWATDSTAMQPGVHERKYEIDSLCYPIRLAYNYWKTTGDTAPFDADWQRAMQSVLRVFRDQQEKKGDNPYSFQRTTPHATDTRPLRGAGYPVTPVGADRQCLPPQRRCYGVSLPHSVQLLRGGEPAPGRRDAGGAGR